MTIRECTWCGDSFNVYGQRVKSERVFCCRTCYAQWLSEDRVVANQIIKQKIVQCDGCGIDISRAPWELKRREKQYCIHDCYSKNEHGKRFSKELNPNWNASVHIQVPCEVCNTLIDRKTYQLQISHVFFCSQTCKSVWMIDHFSGENSPLWLGGHPQYRGADWLVQARATRERDNFTCQKCGVRQSPQRALDVHHIKPFNEFGFIPYENTNYIQANDLSNLITLCKNCHTFAEWRQ